MRTIDEIILHCSDSPFGDAALVDGWHRARGWKGIGYHFVILNAYPDADSHRLRRPQFAQDGVVQPGRPLEQIGAHAQGHNDCSIGICLIGKDEFTCQQFEALTELFAKLRGQFPGVKLRGHYEVIAPGQPIKTCPNLDMDWLRGQLECF